MFSRLITRDRSLCSAATCAPKRCIKKIYIQKKKENKNRIRAETQNQTEKQSSLCLVRGKEPLFFFIQRPTGGIEPVSSFQFPDGWMDGSDGGQLQLELGDSALVSGYWIWLRNWRPESGGRSGSGNTAKPKWSSQAGFEMPLKTAHSVRFPNWPSFNSDGKGFFAFFLTRSLNF